MYSCESLISLLWSAIDDTEGLVQVVATLLEKYKIESSPGDYSLYLVRETGERRLVGDEESPLTLRVTQGPHEVTSALWETRGTRLTLG